MAKEGEEDAGPHSWLIPESELSIMEMIGEGTTAVVFLGKLRGQTVAVKEITVSGDDLDEAIYLSVTRELHVLSRVNHPNILRFLGLQKESAPLRLVLEYCAGGSLFELLHNCWHIPLSWKQRLKFLSDTARAADYLHNFNPPVLHRDLKSLNLMLLESIQNEYVVPHIKLADFGFARVQERAMTQGVGTKHWMAPEVLSSTQYTDKADVFSFAMVVYEVVCRHVPFERLDPTSVARLTRAGKRATLDDSVVPADVPAGLVELIKRCWDQKPEQRPAFLEIVHIVQDIDQTVPESTPP